MVGITDRAASALEGMLATNNAPPGCGVKLTPGNDASTIGMIISEPNEGDDVVRRGDEPLLIVDRQMVDVLDGAEIDCEMQMIDGQERANFTVRPAPGTT
jgi:Fe-S cluster assembly iron-binding protein IscA